MDEDSRDSDELEGRDDDPAGEPQPVVPARDTPLLLGQEAAEPALLQAYRSGRLPHAWLLSGPRGIGKATLAFRFARFLFAEGAAAPGLFAAPPVSLAVAPEHPVFRRVASGGHADLLVVERSFDPKRKKLRSEIVVDDTRSIARGPALAAAGGLGPSRSRVRLIEGLPALDGTAPHAFADRLARADGEDAYRSFAELLPGWVARMVALATGGGEGERAALPGEAQTMRRLAGRRGLDQWVEVWENLNQLFALADSVNLDRKQVVLNAFFALAEAAR